MAAAGCRKRQHGTWGLNKMLGMLTPRTYKHKWTKPPTHKHLDRERISRYRERYITLYIIIYIYNDELARFWYRMLLSTNISSQIQEKHNEHAKDIMISDSISKNVQEPEQNFTEVDSQSPPLLPVSFFPWSTQFASSVAEETNKQHDVSLILSHRYCMLWYIILFVEVEAIFLGGCELVKHFWVLLSNSKLCFSWSTPKWWLYHSR